MFNNNALSLNQAPPIKVVLRFFITGAFFGMVAGIYALFNKEILNFASSEALIFTHILTLGVMASFMFGALFQMLPVLCGVNIKIPLKISLKVHYTLLFGIIFLLSSFYSNGTYIFAILFLSISIFSTYYTLLKELIAIVHTSSSRGIMLAVISLFILTLLGISILLFRAGFNIFSNYLLFKALHFNIAIYGWISILIMSIAFQVVEMFYVTSAYPKIFSTYSTIAIFTLLVLELVFKTTFFEYFIVIILFIFAILTIIRLIKRKRKVSDATIWFWFLGASSLAIFSILVLSTIFLDINYSFIALFFIFFTLSVIFAMSYKIVPFLVWFHLNRQGYFEAPMMHEVMHPKIIRVNFYLFSASFIILLFKFVTSLFYYIGVFLFSISFLMLFINIYNAWQKYIYTQKYSKKIDFNF